jgi:hypothetical protein
MGPRKVRFKLFDKRAALVAIGEHLGMFRDDKAAGTVNNTQVNLVDMPPQETYKQWVARRTRELNKRLEHARAMASSGERGDEGDGGPDD